MMTAAGDRKWVKNLPLVVRNLNSNKSFTTGFSPDTLLKADDTTMAQAVSNIKKKISNRYSTTRISTPLHIGQQVRLKRIISGSVAKPGLLGFWSTPIYSVVQRFESTYPNQLPSYKVEDAKGRSVSGRYAKTQLLPIPPILSADEGQSVPKRPSAGVVGNPNPQPPSAPSNDLVPGSNTQQRWERAEGTQSETRRSLRLEGNDEYEADFISAKRIYRRQTQYLTHWVGYPREDATWEPVRNLANAKDLIREFEDSQA